METDQGGSGICKLFDHVIDRLNHQVHIDRCGDPIVAQCLAHIRTDGQVRYEMIVHDIEMHPVCASLEYRLGVFSQARKVGRQNGRRDDCSLFHFLDEAGLKCQSKEKIGSE